MTGVPEGIELRRWQTGDEDVLCQLANNRRVWRNLTTRFPHPYLRENAIDWIEIANGQPDDACHSAIVFEGGVVGAVGFQRLTDLHTRTAEIGYWIGEPFWGRGIATRSLEIATRLAFDDYDFVRLQAGVLAWNPASCRVLDKAGYTLEGRYRQHVYKDQEVCDLIVYSLLRDSDDRRSP